MDSQLELLVIKCTISLLVGDTIQSTCNMRHLESVGFDVQDPRWIGAWGLGFVILGAVLVVPSLLLMFFSGEQQGTCVV